MRPSDAFALFGSPAISALAEIRGFAPSNRFEFAFVGGPRLLGGICPGSLLQDLSITSSLRLDVMLDHAGEQ